MKMCEVCDGQVQNNLQIIIGEKSHHFDCFECAIQVLAPKCNRCGCRILGRGHSRQGKFFCDSHCAWYSNPHSVTDRQSIIHYL